ncbi:MAG: Acetyltransferase [Frankiales bacterium]|nr:Acetyltransferase [Frankiales bacterium]
MRLVLYRPVHVAVVQSWLDDPEIRANTPVPEPAPADHAANWLTRFGDEGAWVVLDGDADGDAAEVVGWACAPVLDLVRGEAELGYQVAPTHRGRGVATFALRELTDWAFAKGVHRIQLHINNANAASQAVARTCGYSYEGTKRESYLKQGQRVDTQLWSRLVSDPNPMESRAADAYGQGMKS